MLNQKGFSLVQAMVAAGVVGVVALGTLGIMKNAVKVQKTAERSSTINQLYNQAYTALSGSSACTAALAGTQNLVEGDVAVGVASSDISGGSIPQVVTDGAGGTNTLPVLEMNNTYDGVRYLGSTVQRTGPSEVTFMLSFEKEQVIAGLPEKRSTYGGRVRTRPVVVRASFDAGNNLIECHGIDSALADDIMKDTCENALQGVWDLGTKKCLSPAFEPDGGNPAISVVGNIDIQGNVEVDGPVCNGAGCINPANSSCSNTEILTGFDNSTGNASCLDIQSAVQNALATIIPTCGAGETLSHNGGGIFTCIVGSGGGATTGGTFSSYTCQASGWSGPGGSCSSESSDCSTLRTVSVGYNACCPSGPNPMKCMDTTGSGLASYRCTASGWTANPGGDSMCTDPDTVCVAGSASAGSVACCPGAPNALTCPSSGMLTGTSWMCNAPDPDPAPGDFIRGGSCTTAFYAPCDGSSGSSSGGPSVLTAIDGSSICCDPSVRRVTGVGCTNGGLVVSGDSTTGSSCFEAGTKILLSENGKNINIEDLKVGDSVLSFNHEAKRLSSNKLNTLFKRTENLENIILELSNKTKISTTSEHPFFDVNIKDYVEAHKLREGDILQLADGDSVKVIRTSSEKKKMTVYNIEVEGNHNYFAGGVLVHNKGMCPSGGSACLNLCPSSNRCNVVQGNCPDGSGGVNCADVPTAFYGNLACYGEIPNPGSGRDARNRTCR